MDFKSGRYAYKKTLIHILAMIIFVAVSAIYSKMFFVETNQQYIENTNYNKTTCLWDQHSHSGCPAISQGQTDSSNPFAKAIQASSRLGKALPFCLILISLIGFYILLISLEISPLSAIIGSLAFGLFSYGIGEIQAGEYMEMTAISLMPYLLTGIVCIFRGKMLIGTTIALIFTALLTATCHFQLVCYTLLVAIILIIAELFAKGKSIGGKLLPTGITIAVIAVAFFTNSEHIFQEYEYSKYASEQLPDYETNAAYFDDSAETLSLVLPSIKGGKSSAKLSENSETYNLLEPLFGQENSKIICEESPIYFGKKHFSNGTTYIGSIAILLALFGSIASKKRIKWWAIAASIIAIILSCGNIEYFIAKNIPLFYNFNHFSNILIIAAIGISILAAIGAEEIIAPNTETTERKEKISLYISTGIISVILLIFVAFPSIAGDCSINSNNRNEIEVAEGLSSYMPQDMEYAEAVADFKNDYINAIRTDRISIIRRDAAKSLLFVLLGSTAIFFSRKKKLNEWIIATTLIVLAVTDITLTNSQLKGDKNSNETTSDFAYSQINADNDTFRVIDLRYNTAQSDNTTCMKFNSIGGENGYCTKRYRTFCDTILNKELALTRYNILSWAQRDGMTTEEIQEVFSQKFKSPALDMLNVKYIILSDKASPLINHHASGNAWFADSIRWSNSEPPELAQLKHVDTRKTAIVNEKYKTEFADIEFAIDSSDYIKLVAADGDIFRYESSCSGNRVAIFSETFYPKGWKAQIDNKKASFFRCNYILRGMIIPQGKHEIEFRYEPQSAKTGATVSIASNIVLAIIIIISIILQVITSYRRKHNIQNDKE
ncbi:MAG: YfhO family protein [Bacteroidales bacterium]|nr:YfhO family protein [Bacteroidales bacterium]